MKFLPVFFGTVALACGILTMDVGEARSGDMLWPGDARLQGVLAANLPVAMAQFDQFSCDRVQVYHQRIFNAEVSQYTEVENQLWWVARGESEDLANYVRDFSPGVTIAEVRAYVIPAGKINAAAALSATAVPLDKSRITISKGNKTNRYSTLVIAFDTVNPGDLIGVSVKTKVNYSLHWEDWLLAGLDPVSYCGLVVRNPPNQAYIAFGNRFRPGTMKSEMTGDKSSEQREMTVWAHSVYPLKSEPFSPPMVIQSPSITLAWRALRLGSGAGDHVWLEYNSWNMVAKEMAAHERFFVRKHKEAVELAKSLTAEAPATDWPEILYEHVRDEFLEMDSFYFEHDSDKTTVDDVIKARAGGLYEKAYVLATMLRAVGVAADIGWAHDPETGAFFADYPNWGQVTVPLVRVISEGQELWFDLGCGSCVDGKVPNQMVGTDVAVYRRDADQKEKSIWKAIDKRSNLWGLNAVAHYKREVARADWVDMSQLATTTRSDRSRFSEVLTLDGGDGEGYCQGRIQLQSDGATSLQGVSETTTGDAELLEAWAQARFSALSVDTTLIDPIVDSGLISGEFGVTFGPVPPPMADTWILPPALVFGEPSVPAWPEPRYSAFYVAHDKEIEWEFRIRLPEGWASAELPADRSFGVNCFLYSISYAIEDGAFVARRRLKERAGTVDSEAGLRIIGRHANTIREIELAPIVLSRSQ